MLVQPVGAAGTAPHYRISEFSSFGDAHGRSASLNTCVVMADIESGALCHLRGFGAAAIPAIAPSAGAFNPVSPGKARWMS